MDTTGLTEGDYLVTFSAGPQQTRFFSPTGDPINVTSIPTTIRITPDPTATDDSVTVDEDSTSADAANTFNVLTNDSTLAEPLTVEDFTQPANGAVVYNGDGTFTFTPAANFHGDTSFTYTIQNGNADEATATVEISVTSINDPPVATDGTLPLVENAANSTLVGQVQAADVDAGAEGTLSYAITSGNTDGAFAIDAGGNITVNNTSAIDFETNSVFNLEVTVSDGGSPNLSDTALITVSLSDVNETPTAPDAPGSVAEDAANATLVATVAATDPDGTAPNNSLTYAITAGNTGDAFAINSNGQVTVADSTAIDFETLASYSLTVTVTDGGGLSDTATVEVTVTDVNEGPTANDATGTIAEDVADASLAATVVATDPDIVPPNSTLTYAITAGNTGGAFAINSAGQVTVADSSAIDFETLASYSLTVTVTDGGDLSDTATVEITVTDVNEAPTAVDASGTLAEDVADATPVATVVATDPDGTAPNNTLTYAITAGDPDGAFAIDSDGEVTVADSSAIDFETLASYSLTVTVTDGGSPALSDTATVSITVTDVNEAPAAADATGSVAENSANATLVATVVATDPDSSAPNNTLTYAITAGDPDGAFAINSDGEVTVADSSAIDFETLASYSLTVTVTDGGDLSDTATVEITVTDVNEAPTANDAAGTIAEDVADATLVATVAATDPDSTAPNNTLTYAITSGDPDGAFAINSDGEVTVADSSAIDFETLASYSLTVTVTDGGGLSDTATVEITVTDVNEAPTAADASGTIAEDVADATPVATVVATDPDGTAPNNTLTYAITGGDPDGAFAINSGGEVTVADSSAIDFETLASYSLTVTVTDGGSPALSDTATVSITVTDINEAPTADDASGTIAEDVADDTLVATVGATDPDIVPPNSSLTYAITAGDPDGAFAINSDGEVTVADSSAIDFETLASYSLTVTVTDGGGLSDTATVDITVTDVNEAPTAADASGTIAEDAADATPVATVVATDPDGTAPNNTLTYAITGGDPDGAFAISSDGEVTVADSSVIDFETLASYSLTVTVTDGGDLSDTATVDITINDVNEAPTAADASGTIAEDAADATPVATVVATDPDGTAPNNTLTYAITGGDPDGAFAINSDGEVTIADSSAIDFDIQASYSLTVTVTDGGGLSDTATVDITVTDVNEAPTANDATGTVDEDAANDTVVLTVAATDPDSMAPNNTLTYAITAGNTGDAFAINSDGEVTVADNSAIDFETLASYSLTVTVTDGGGLSDTATVDITVANVNEAPLISNGGAAISLDEGAPVGTSIITVMATDADVGDTPEFSIDSGNTDNAFAIDSNSGEITVANSAAVNTANQPFTLTVIATDDGGLTDTATFTVNVNNENDPPLADSATVPANEDIPITITLTGSDGDVGPDQQLTFTIVTGPINGILGPVTSTGLDTATVVYTPNGDFNGQDSFTFTVTDDDSIDGTTLTSAEATITIEVAAVNDAPMGVDDETTTAEDTPVTLDVVANDIDADVDSLTVLDVGTPANGMVTFSGREVTYTPAANFSGVDTFTYTVDDGNGGTNTASVTVTVTPVNDAPDAVDDADSTDEDTPVTIAVLANDTDVEGDDLTITAAGGASNGSVTFSGGEVTYTPDANFNGDDTFTYTIDDGNGGTDTATVTVTVDAVNDAPVAVSDLLTTNEDTAVTFDVSANDTDPDGDTLTVLSVGTADNGMVTFSGGEVTYTPDPGFNGSDSFTYTISDGNGGTDTTSVGVTVIAVNDAPVAANDTASTDEDTAVTIDVVANDSDAEGDTLTVTAAGPAANGSVTFSGGSVTYTPNANFNGSDSFSYTVEDDTGGTDTATVTVTVDAVNDDPVAVSDLLTTNEDIAVTFDVSANDTDVDGDTLTVLSVGTADNGMVTFSGGEVTYTPDPGFNGSDSFTYTISDGNGGTDTTSVGVTVIAVNDAPVAEDDTASTDEDTAVTIDVVANDSDAEGDTLTVTAAGPAANGSVSFSGGSVTYTPNANFNGNDSFTYTVSDGTSTSAATVSVTVAAVNDAPVAVNDSATVIEDNSVTINVLGNDTDIDGDTVTIVSFTQGTSGVVTQSGNQLVYTPNANSTASDSFSYTITDGTVTATATVSITVTAVGDLPIARDDTASVLVGSANNQIFVLANDEDPDGDPLTIIGLTTPDSGGTVTISDNGTPGNPADDRLIYTPAAGFDGIETFEYTIADGTGGTATALVAVTVDSNAAPVATDDSVAGIAIDSMNNVISSLLDNDLGEPGETLEIIAVSQGSAGGSISILPGGTSVEYTPPAGFQGRETFTYTLSDNTGPSDNPAGPLTDTATVSVIVGTEPVFFDGDDLVVLGTGNSDRIVFYASNSPGLVHVRLNNDNYGPFSMNGGGLLTAFGLGGNDSIIAAGRLANAGMFDGGEANDYLAGSSLDDTFLGGGGNDVMLVGEGNNFADGGDGSDRIEGRSGIDTLFGGTGNDRLNGGAGEDYLDGGDGNDFVFGGDDDDFIRGGSGDDNLSGYLGNDIVLGEDGIDMLFGRSGNDVLIGGTGSDRVRGDSGDDLIISDSTNYDANDAALMQILAAWTSGAGITTRISNIQSGPNPLIKGSTVFDDSSVDDLTGDSGEEWFIGFGTDSIRDFRSDDIAAP